MKVIIEPNRGLLKVTIVWFNGRERIVCNKVIDLRNGGREINEKMVLNNVMELHYNARTRVLKVVR